MVSSEFLPPSDCCWLLPVIREGSRGSVTDPLFPWQCGREGKYFCRERKPRGISLGRKRALEEFRITQERVMCERKKK